MRNWLGCPTFRQGVLGSPEWLYTVGNKDKLENGPSWNSPGRILFLVSWNAGAGCGTWSLEITVSLTGCTTKSSIFYKNHCCVDYYFWTDIVLTFQNIIYFPNTISLLLPFSNILNILGFCLFWVPFKSEGLVKIPSSISYGLHAASLEDSVGKKARILQNGPSL